MTWAPRSLRQDAPLCLALADWNEVVMTEALRYPAFRAAAEYARLRVRGLEMDEEGITVDAHASTAAMRLSLTGVPQAESVERALEKVAHLLEVASSALL